MSELDQIIIHAPDQQEFRNPEAILNIKELKQWIEELPLLMPDPTIRRLTETITAINLQKLNHKTRLGLLSEFRNICLQLFPSLNQDGLKRLSIKEVQREQVHNSTTQLCMHIASGYKIILRDLYQDKEQPRENDIFTPLLYAIEMYSLALLNCYRTYRSAPASLYKDIHQIYFLSEKAALLDVEIERDKHSLTASSIGNIYRQIMILAFLDPFHMPAGVAEALQNRLCGLAQYCSILSRIPDLDSSGIFVVDLETDEAPRVVYRISGHKNLKLARVFDTQPLSNKIRADITILQSAEGTMENKREIQILQRLIPPDKESQSRKSERQASERTCKVTFGIDAVYRFLNLSALELQRVLESNADIFGSHLLETWRITNESNGGMNLQNKQTTRHDVRVGDIIGLLSEKNDNGKSQGRIAIIRWIRNEQDNNLNIGIELIQGNILPATCRLLDGTEANNIISGIFISSCSDSDTPATLLTPKSVYRRGREMEITIGDQPLRIEAGFLRDDTFTFDRFDFSSLKT